MIPTVRREVGLERSFICPIFTAPFGGLSLVYRVVLIHVASGGFWDSHTRRVRLCLLQLRIFYRWRLLRVQLYAANYCDPCDGHFSVDPSSSALSLTTSILLRGHAFLRSRHIPNEFRYAILPHSDNTPDGSLHSIVVVSDALLKGCRSLSGLFVCYLLITISQ